MNFILSKSSDLKHWCDYFARASAIAVDTEFCRINTYWPKLALIQLSDGQETVLIDPLAKGTDLLPVRDLLANPHPVKIFHSCRQDLELLLKIFRELPINLFDTQLAYTFLHPVEEVSLARMLEAQIGVTLNKSKQNTDWMRRPLSPSQLIYAANDVFYLPAIKNLLSEKLKSLGRYEWFMEEQATQFVPQTFAPTTNYWMRLAKRRNHKSRQLHILKSLCDWREIVAQELNYNRKRVLSDEVILQLCEKVNLQEHVNVTVPAGYQTVFSALLEQILAVPEEKWPPRLKRKPMTTQEQEHLERLRVLLEKVATELHISPKLIATTEELKSYVRGHSDSPFLKGWRLKVFGHAAKNL
ncbi:MAG: ribonuclease D [Candidatus Paracaedibacteraceae bacterium]|nr:ribonuclease D [Candidatus Paracaedibacteraceae bacterium]